jgi:ubiquinone/menaquinone biosynthesis C-methylase UbiE
MSLRGTFDHEALLYEQARPLYPDELFDKLVDVTGLRPGSNLLEIGPGTGQATVPMAKRGFHITGIELGEHLADVARHALSHYPRVKIITGAFEDAELPPHSFNLVYSATAFHWIQPEVKFIKAHQLLVPEGHLAVIHTNHVSDEHGDAFHHAVQPIYDHYWPSSKEPFVLPKASELKPPDWDEHLFRAIYFHVFPMSIRYDAQRYIDLLSTYSPTIALPPDKRRMFLDDIKNVIDHQFGGHHTKHFAMSLAIAQASTTPKS